MARFHAMADQEELIRPPLPGNTQRHNSLETAFYGITDQAIPFEIILSRSPIYV